MKRIAFILLIAIAACSTQKNIQIKKIDDTSAQQDSDSVSYELIVLDPGFDSWYTINSKPNWYHSNEYYQYWNQRYVQAWNYDYQSRSYSKTVEGYIDYDSNTDYPLELNHKLFYYFQYVVHVLHIPLITDGPQTY